MGIKIVFIIIAYHPKKNALLALTSKLLKWPVILIDNTKNNRGYGGGANVGIRQALRRGAKWVVILNQDVEMTKKSVVQLIDILKKSPPAIVGPFDGSLDTKRWTTHIPAVKMDYISGSCMAIHQDVFKKIGEFFEPYFLYYEEVDLCMRASRAGFPLRWFPIRGIAHEESVGLGRGSFLHQYYLARNHMLFVERQAPWGIKFYETVRFPKTVIKHILRKEWGALRGIGDYLLRRFGFIGVTI